MLDIRGWQRLTVHDAPPLAAARQDFLSWLAGAPEPWHTIWGQRLESSLDHPHLSARLEIYLHHYFKSNDWSVEIEPQMTSSPSKPDFLVTRHADCLLVEAKTVLDQRTIEQETGRLRRLADDLSSKLSRDVMIQPQSDLPSSLPSRKIQAQIEQRARVQAQEILEFDLSDVHQGTPYSLKVIILPGVSSVEPGGVVPISGVHRLVVGERVRDALEQKAGKYGSIDMPLLIAVWGAGEFPVTTRDELDALFGDREWLVPAKGVGEGVTERRKANGFFTSVRKGKHRHEQVSGVLFYRFKWLNNGYEHRIHIYHNPFALCLLKHEFFPGVPQLLARDASVIKWINGEPADA